LAWYSVTTAIFAVLIYFADLQKFIQALTDVKVVYVAFATVFGVSTFLFWAAVWQVLFGSLNIKSRFSKTVRMALAGNFMNSVTPLGQFGGEPFMAYIVSKNTGASYEKSLSCIVSADIMSASPIITYMGAGLIYMMFWGVLENIFVKLVYLTIALMVFGLILVYFIWFEEDVLKNYLFGALDFLESRIAYLEKYSDSVKSRILEVERSFSKVGDNPAVILKGLVLSHLAIGAQFAALYLVLISKGLEPSLTAIFFTVIISGFSIWAPTPGGSGAYEATFSTVLMLFYSISLDIALTVAILFRISTFWSGIVIGYPAILSLGSDVEQT
jgi:uncharacterized protein (TIRG00374 family)